MRLFVKNYLLKDRTTHLHLMRKKRQVNGLFRSLSLDKQQAALSYDGLVASGEAIDEK